MFHKRLRDNATNEDEALYDLNVLGLWCATGNEWTSRIKQESLELTHQSLAAGKSGSRSIRGSVLLGVLATVALLGAATLIQASVESWTPQQNAKEL